jgi:hypothetical protein
VPVPVAVVVAVVVSVLPAQFIPLGHTTGIAGTTAVLTLALLSRHGMPFAVFEQMSVADTVTVPCPVSVFVALGSTTT